jgi:uncharacterized membrane protein
MQAPPISTTASAPREAAVEERETDRSRDPAAGRRIPWWIWVLAGALFVSYAALSVRRHDMLLSHSFDLGIFEQAVRSYAEGHLPVSEVKGPDFPVLGDHFSPVLALIAPLYLLHPSTDTLLVVHAALIASSVIPLALWARRTLGAAAAVVIGLCYGLSWGIASAVGFDFHEVAFAVPLLACSLTALANDRLRAAAYWALPLLLVKEDLGISVAVIGLLIARRGDRRLGIVTAVCGVTGTLLAMTVILPAFNPSGSYGYLMWLDGPGGEDGGLPALLHRLTIGLITPVQKITTLVLLLAPTLFLALRSPLLLVAVPTVLWRFASSNEVHWGTGYHYSLVLMPIVFAAFVDALVRRRSAGGGVRRYLAASAAITALLLPQFPLWQLVQPATWRSDHRRDVADSVMDLIPEGATVQASTHLVPHLVSRTSVSLYGWADSRPYPEWIMVDTRVPDHLRWPQSAAEEKFKLRSAVKKGYRTVADREGFVLLERPSSASGRSLGPEDS